MVKVPTDGTYVEKICTNGHRMLINWQTQYLPCPVCVMLIGAK